MGKMYCTNCGNELDNDSNFCDNCGNTVSDNITNKPNINKFSSKSISDIINPILERPKLLLLIIIILIAIIGVNAIFNSNTNSNTFNGQETTVNGVNFYIPKGFTYYSLPGTSPEREADFALHSSDGKRALAYIHIKVSDTTSVFSAEKASYNNKITINGKECYLNVPHTSSYDVYCAYDTNGKTVQLNVPYYYEYNNNVFSYEETLAGIIE